MDYEDNVREIINSACYDVGYAKRFLQKLKKRSICLYGLGAHGKNWYNYLSEQSIDIDYLFDNNPNRYNNSSEIFTKGKFLSSRELYSMRDKLSVLVAIRDSMPVIEKLKSEGFTNIYAATVNMFSFDANYRYSGNPKKLRFMEKNILELLDLCEDDYSRMICLQTIRNWFDESAVSIPVSDNQYFIPDIMVGDKEESFLDVGAYDGDTIKGFLRWCNGKWNHIYALEMENDNYNLLRETVYDRLRLDPRKVTIYNMGAWDNDTSLAYRTNGSSSSFIKDGGKRALLKRLDNILMNKKITFIKMDIEGAEMKALKGGREIIIKNHPKLAICTYHKAEHLWEIPFYAKDLYSKYRVYFRHHGDDECETVCYIIP